MQGRTSVRPCDLKLCNQKMKHKLIIAYGNPDRQDDGAGWYVLQKIAHLRNIPVTSYNDDFYELLGHNPDVFFTLQLTPELSDLVNAYDEVCFIDASVGSNNTQLDVRSLQAAHHLSPLSHHLSPETLLDITKSTYTKYPSAYLLTIPGKDFGFSDQLSSQALLAAEAAVKWLLDWMDQQV